MAVVAAKSQMGAIQQPSQQSSSSPEASASPTGDDALDVPQFGHSNTDLDDKMEDTTTLSPLLAVEICRGTLRDLTPFIPEFEILSPSPISLLKLWGMTPTQLHELVVTNSEELCTLFHQGALALFGASQLGKELHVQILLNKVESMLHLVVSNDLAALHHNPGVVNPVAVAVLILSQFCLFDPSFHQKVNLHMLLFDITNRFSNFVSLGVVIKTHFSRISIAQTIKDANYWFAAAVALSAPHVRDCLSVLSLLADTELVSGTFIVGRDGAKSELLLSNNSAWI